MTQNSNQNQNAFQKNWVLQGVIWGILMILFMEVLYPLSQKEPITLKSLTIGIPLWLIGGLVIGYVSKTVFNKMGKDTPAHNQKIGQ